MRSLQAIVNIAWILLVLLLRARGCLSDENERQTQSHHSDQEQFLSFHAYSS